MVVPCGFRAPFLLARCGGTHHAAMAAVGGRLEGGQVASHPALCGSRRARGSVCRRLAEGDLAGAWGCNEGVQPGLCRRQKWGRPVEVHRRGA